MTHLQNAGRPALSALRALADDRAEVLDGVTVADVVCYPVFMLESNTWRLWDAEGR